MEKLGESKKRKRAEMEELRKKAKAVRNRVRMCAYTLMVVDSRFPSIKLSIHTHREFTTLQLNR